MSQVLYRKWRPQTWSEVVGQDHVTHTLRNALVADRGAHAYLFAGPRGTGKTTTARILAKAVNCLDEDLAKRPCDACDHCQAVLRGRFLDLIEIDAASNTSVDDVRDLREKINFSPNQGRFKVYIIDEVHMLSTAAFNALLKTLEEPPPHAIFVLATTEAHKIPATVTSRCQCHEFRRIPLVDILSQLQRMADGEEIQVEQEALMLIARQATGSLRDAISLLDQLASTGQSITLQMAQTVLGTATVQSVLDIVDALVNGASGAGLNSLHRALDGGSDPRQFARQIVDYMRDLLLISMGSADQVEATGEQRLLMTRHAQAFSTPELLRMIRAFNIAASEGRGFWLPSLPLEMAFVESLSKPQLSEGTPQENSPAQPTNSPQMVSVTNSRFSSQDIGQSSSEVDFTPQDRQATQTLAESWARMLDWVRKQNPKAYGLLNSSKSRFILGNRLILNFASDVLKSQMEKEDNRDVAEKALQQVFQRPIIIQCRVDMAKRDAIPQGVDEDGMVAAALRDLGGEIVDLQ